MKNKAKVLTTLFVVFIIVIFIYNIYILYDNNEKLLFKSKLADIIVGIDTIENNYFGIKTDSIFVNINMGIIWFRSIKECQSCVNSQEEILSNIKYKINLPLYLYLDGYDYRSRHLKALQMGYENNLIEPIFNIEKYIQNTPLLLFIYNKRIILSNIGYKETQGRTLSFLKSVERFIKNKD
jgi:hypothetical protein